MSTWQAIAGVTIMLEQIITEGVMKELGSGTLGTVTTKPLDRAREGGEENNQINIFLYQTGPNTAWRNLDMPNKVKPGETGKPPLALNLYYLITAYGEKNDEIQTHSLLGSTMRVLHDRPLITSQYIHELIKKFGKGGEDEKKQILVGSDIENQLERISVTPKTLSLEEISKLWGTFQIQYRLSAAYEVSVVLIESKRPVKTPLPVLSRGPEDKGVGSQTGTIPPAPSIIAITAIKHPEKEEKYTIKEDEFKIGKDMIIEGYHLLGDILLGDSPEDDQIEKMVQVEVHCQNYRAQNKIVIKKSESDGKKEEEKEIKEITDRQIKVSLLSERGQGEDQQWLAGFYTVTVKYRLVEGGNKNGNIWEERETNAMNFTLRPKIEITDKQIKIRKDKKNENELEIKCEPPVKKGQLVALLLGDREISYKFPQNPKAEYEEQLNFDVSKIPAGEYIVRLRVDGVDSLPIDFGKQPPQYKDDQKVKIYSTP